MRILHATWSAGFGGIERIVYDLSCIQHTKPDYKVGVLFGQAKGEFVDLYRDQGIICHSLDLRNGYDLRPSKLRHGAKLMSEYDIVHVHSFNPAICRCAVRSGAGIVYTDHSSHGRSRTLTSSDHVKLALLKRFLNRRANHVTLNSKFTLETAESMFGLQQVSHSVVYNGMVLRQPDTLMASLPSEIQSRVNGKFVIGTVAKFKSCKRIDWLIRSYSRLKRRDEAVLMIVGDGPLRKDYERVANTLGVGNRVIFTGFQIDVAAYQNAMDVFVCPSRHESFGLVVIEALSLGKPTIVMSDGGGAAEIVHAWEPDDVVKSTTALTDRLDFYIGHCRESTSVQQSRADYVRRFDISRMEREMNDIYTSIVSRPP